MKTKFTVDYFIKKFKKIPEKEIGEGELQRHCALWHLGISDLSEKSLTDEVLSLAEILEPMTNRTCSKFEVIYSINDGLIMHTSVPGSTPKQRILNALKQAKKLKK